jgi:hypothetical protein
VRFLVIFVGLIAIQSPASLRAEPPPTTLVPSAEFQTLITRIVRQALPAEYEKRHNWNHTQRVFDGWKLEWDGGKLETRRRWKEANDAQWHVYRVNLVDPEQTFRVHVERFQALESGKVLCDLAVDTKLAVEGRLLQWDRGVQLLSIDAQAEAEARLWARLEIGGKVDVGKFPPSLYLEPVVQDAAVDLPRFRILRIGKLDGPLVKSLSHGAREVIEEKLAEARPKLVDKMNAEIKKSEAKLKLSVTDLLNSPWGKAVEPLVK